MLGKLIKHEFRATGRIMLPLFLVMLFVSVLANFAIKHFDNTVESSIMRVFMVIIIIIFFIGLASMIFVSLILTVNRFRSNLLGDEGYLTFTLPVSVHSLIWSKVIVSTVWFIAAVAVMICSGLIAAFEVAFIHDFARLIKQIFDSITTNDVIEVTGITVQFAVMTVLSCATLCLIFYSAVSVGHGFANHKMLFSVIAFFVISIAMSLIDTAIGNLIDMINLDNGLIEVALSDSTKEFHIDMAIANLVIALHGAVYYIITVYNLKHRLNLE